MERQTEALEIMQQNYSGAANQLIDIRTGKYGRIVVETERVDGGPFLDPLDELYETGRLIGNAIAQQLEDRTLVETEHNVRVKESYGDWYIDVNETRLFDDRKHSRGTVFQLRKNGSGWEIPYTSNMIGEDQELVLQGVAEYCRKLDQNSLEDLV